MKKTFVIILSMVLTVCLLGCAKKAEGNNGFIAYEITASADETDGGLHLNETDIWSKENCNAFLDSSIQESKTIVLMVSRIRGRIGTLLLRCLIITNPTTIHLTGDGLR